MEPSKPRTRRWRTPEFGCTLIAVAAGVILLAVSYGAILWPVWLFTALMIVVCLVVGEVRARRPD